MRDAEFMKAAQNFGRLRLEPETVTVFEVNIATYCVQRKAAAKV